MDEIELEGIDQYDSDSALEAILAALLAADPDGTRAAQVFRYTYDILYDGQHTGRYRWDQLFKTEKTHYGTLFEINFRRAFDDVIDDAAPGDLLDYRVLGHDIDCKYSQRAGGWMLPPECFGHLLLVATADDAAGTWSLGIVRASEANRRLTANRDQKSQLNRRGNSQICWLRRDAPLPPNVLLSLPDHVVARIFAPRSGQGRVTELLRTVTGRRIGRNTIATLAQQDDYMARLRDNGNGARTTLRAEGYLIPGGDYRVHAAVARDLGQPVPLPGEVVSLRVVLDDGSGAPTTFLDGRHWRVARGDEPTAGPAPLLPSTKKPPPA